MNTLGKAGENAAVCKLCAKGYRILARNFSCRFGEIDIIAFKDDTVVFVEVKTRGRNPVASPGESVTASKQKKIILTAIHYINYNRLENIDIRFDVIEVEMYGIHCKINHIENAFDAEGFF